MDEIYINAMLTMFLNDYNGKHVRDTTFLFKPFNEIKKFTISWEKFWSKIFFSDSIVNYFQNS